MKVLTILMIGLALGVSGCGKKKKATPKKTNTADKAKDGDKDTVSAKGMIAYTVTKEGESYKIQFDGEKHKEANQKTMKNGTCDVSEVISTVAGTQNMADLELKEEMLTISSSGTAILSGKATDDKKDKIDGNYDTGKDGVVFTMSAADGEGDLAIQKNCKKK